MPPVDMLTKFDHSLALKSNELAAKWISGNFDGDSSDIKDWSSPQIGKDRSSKALLYT